MRREQRLRRRQDFAAAYRKGRVQSNQLLVIRVLAHEGAVTRFGFVAGKVVGGAVVRNRIKRRLREIARGAAVRPGLDIVIGARKPAATAEFQALRTALVSLMKRAGALAETPPAPSGQENS
jgi:ribonuclease P protein component